MKLMNRHGKVEKHIQNVRYKPQRSRCRGNFNTNIAFKAIGCKDADWTNVAKESGQLQAFLNWLKNWEVFGLSVPLPASESVYIVTCYPTGLWLWICVDMVTPTNRAAWRTTKCLALLMTSRKLQKLQVRIQPVSGLETKTFIYYKEKISAVCTIVYIIQFFFCYLNMLVLVVMWRQMVGPFYHNCFMNSALFI